MSRRQALQRIAADQIEEQEAVCFACRHPIARGDYAYGLCLVSGRFTFWHWDCAPENLKVGVPGPDDEPEPEEPELDLTPHWWEQEFESPHCFTCRKPIEIGQWVQLKNLGDVIAWWHGDCVPEDEAA